MWLFSNKSYYKMTFVRKSVKNMKIWAGGAGGGLRIWYVQGYWRNSKWIFQVLIKNNAEFSRRDQEINYVEFPGTDLRP